MKSSTPPATPSTPQEPGHSYLDVYSPAQIARQVRDTGVAKAHLGVLPTLTLGLLAGAFIGLGAAFYLVVVTGAMLGFGPERLLGGVAFSLGLVLVVVAGAELFTGNNLIVMAWVSRRVTLGKLLRNWTLVYLANLVGAVATAYLVHASGVLEMDAGRVARTAVGVADAKVALPWTQALVRGVLCNALVCLAVWLCTAAGSVEGKVLAVVFPVSAFVALGFEHSVANMFLIPLGMFSGASSITPADFLGNLLPVTLGNIIGGSGLVALIYWAVYLRGVK
ncbi:MAG: formate/nitrite transporter family protein [Nitrospirota bacterium]|nr:formate/nitrite transporter family protein [Nitrospirota bacterium]